LKIVGMGGKSEYVIRNGKKENRKKCRNSRKAGYVIRNGQKKVSE
jgi:hypothetical protein